MGKPLRALLLARSEDEAAPVVRALRRGGFETAHERVSGAGAMRDALGQSCWDIVIACLAASPAERAATLAAYREAGTGVPLVVVPERAGTRAAVEAMRAGASDCLPKRELPRLAACVERALRAERPRAERRETPSRRDREGRMRAIFDTAVDGIVTIDERGVIESFNPAAERLFGYAAGEVIGRNVSMLMPAPDAEKHDAYIARYLRTGERRIIGIGREVRALRRDGATFPIDLAVSEVRLGGRRIFTGFVRDISERRLLEEQLQQAQKMEGIGRLAGGVAHDFNNLLTAILGYTELAEAEIPADSAAQICLKSIRQASDRAAALTHQLLAFARRQIIEPRIVSLNDLILDLHGMLRRLIGEDVELRTLPEPDLGRTRVDPGQFGQILFNLAVNARDAMPEGGRLTLETANVTLDEEYARQHVGVAPGEYVMLAVSDTGAGMTEEVKAHLFEPFFTTKEQGKGTGLGLATCYGIVKQSGGDIRVYSEPGRGTVFKIYLPRVEAAAPFPDPPEDPGALPHGTETVLLAEDDPLVRDIGARALRAQGYTVLEAADGEEALRVAAGHAGPIHLLVTDVVMPRLGGLALSEGLLRGRPATRVLYTSGYTDHAIVHQGALEPGIAFLQKPFTPAALARRVREELDRPADGPADAAG